MGVDGRGGGGVEQDGPVGDGLTDADDEGAGGGGGGGAIAIHSTVSIAVLGTIDASGGDGSSAPGCGDIPGLGGGGAGGSIELVSPATDVLLGVLDVSGGLGGYPLSDLPASIGMAGGNGGDGNVSVV